MAGRRREPDHYRPGRAVSVRSSASARTPEKDAQWSMLSPPPTRLPASGPPPPLRRRRCWNEPARCCTPTSASLPPGSWAVLPLARPTPAGGPRPPVLRRRRGGGRSAGRRLEGDFASDHVDSHGHYLPAALARRLRLDTGLDAPRPGVRSPECLRRRLRGACQWPRGSIRLWPTKVSTAGQETDHSIGATW